MSDYGEGNYSDGDYEYDPWYYIEETYQTADDLAEHTVASPPAQHYDEDYSMYDDFDLFDYWYDIEEGDADMEGGEGMSLSTNLSKPGQKRKRNGKAIPARKTRKLNDGKIQAPPVRPMSPTPTVLWLSQHDRDAQRAAKVKFLDENLKPYALLKDWRENLGSSPKMKARVVEEPEHAPEIPGSHLGKGKQRSIADSLSPSPEAEDDEMLDLVTASGIAPEALMTALEGRLADARGLEGFDKSMLLKYAMRMLANEDASDDIAGELTEDLLNREDDDPEAVGIASWISQQLGPTEEEEEEEKDDDVEPEKDRVESFTKSSTRSSFAIPLSSAVAATERHPPTPPSIETAASTANLGLSAVKAGSAGQKTTTNAANDNSFTRSSKHKPTSKAPVAATAMSTTQSRTRKRKADADDVENTEPAPESKRPTRSYNAPTAASQAKAAAPATSKSTRPGKGRRG